MEGHGSRYVMSIFGERRGFLQGRSLYIMMQNIAAAFRTFGLRGSFSSVIKMLEYKAELHGTHVVHVDPAGTTKE